MADTSLVFNILAHDKASGVVKRFGTGAKIALAGAAAAAFKFGKDSVAAYTEAQESQAHLQDAFRKFPKLADTNIGRLQALNSALEQKTKFDDDATASGQAVLAQFGLTGRQIEQITPLLQDYAAKTGKDLPTAARDLGKAVLGQGRALKNVGLDLKDTGSHTKNLDNLMAGLRTQVGGFAEEQGKTAAGQAEILRNNFGEVQETIGAKLLPVLLVLAQDLLKVINFIQRNQAVIGPLVATIGTFTAGLLGASKAIAVVNGALKLMGVSSSFALGPIGLIIIAVGALAVGLIYAYKHSETFRAIVITVFKAVGGFVLKTISGILRTIGQFIGIAAKIPGPWQGAMRKAAASINGAADKVDRLNRKLQAIPTRKSVNINVRWNTVNTLQDVMRRSGLSEHQIRAKGGPVTAGRQYLVGEEGPELVTFGRSGYVHDAATTRTMGRHVGAGGAGSGGGPLVIRLEGGASGLDRMFLTWLKGALRANPGIKLVTS